MNAPSALQVRVACKAVEAQDICSFELVAADGRPLPAFSAGSHVDVQLPGGITRQYSLCNDPNESHRYLIGVLRDPASRGGSASMHDRVNEGDTLTIQACADDFDDVAVNKEPGRSHEIELRVVSPTALDLALNEAQGRIQQELLRLQKQQQEALAKVTPLAAAGRRRAARWDAP